MKAEIEDYRKAIFLSVVEIDTCDSSRVSLREALDTVRDILEKVYGKELTNEVNQNFGIKPKLKILSRQQIEDALVDFVKRNPDEGAKMYKQIFDK